VSRPRRATLEVVTPRGKQNIPLTDRPVTLGRADDCDVVIPEPFVSSIHARIEPHGSGYVVRDVGSTNGTWVNNTQVDGDLQLESGASLILGRPGNYRLRFISHHVESSAPSPKASSSESNRNLREVLEISKALLSTLDLEEVLGRVLDACLRISHAERGYLFLKQGAELKLRARRDDQQDPSSAKQVEFSHSVASRVAASGHAEFLSDLEGGEGKDNSESMVRLRLQTVACVPLKIQQRVIGIVYLDSHLRATLPDRTGREVLEVLAGLAAVAIENARMVEERVESERWSTIGRMAASIVHDIRSPMAALRGTAELLRSKLSEPAHRDKLNVIIGEVDRLTQLSSEMLEFSTGAIPLRVENLSLAAVVEEFLKTIEPRLEKEGIRLERRLEEGGALALDRQKMARLLHNVVGNSLEAMEPGGVLTVEVSISGERPILAVSDSGSGMDKETMQRVFEPFFSHGKEHGVGLGMSIVRRIAEQHGAEIAIHSTPGQGTRVEFHFPQTQSAAA